MYIKQDSLNFLKNGKGFLFSKLLKSQFYGQKCRVDLYTGLTCTPENMVSNLCLHFMFIYLFFFRKITILDCLEKCVKRGRLN